MARAAQNLLTPITETFHQKITRSQFHLEAVEHRELLVVEQEKYLLPGLWSERQD